MTVSLMKFVVSSAVALATSVAVASPVPAKEGAAPATTDTTTAPTTTEAAKVAASVPSDLTVEGTIKKVEAKKKEIYVMPSGSGAKKLEFYFPDNAQFLKGGQSVGFDALKEGQKVKVTYTKTGKRLNPSKAEILE